MSPKRSGSGTIVLLLFCEKSKKSDFRRQVKATLLIQVLQSSVVETSQFMQGRVVELIRELMQAQRMSVRKISAQIAHEQGGSAMGYTQQINRILNDPDYDPNFSTVQKILAALNYSLWQSPPADLATIEAQLSHLSSEMATLKATVDTLSQSVQSLSTSLSGNRGQGTGSREQDVLAENNQGINGSVFQGQVTGD